MGVIHKLKPEILDFILETKKSQPLISCRSMAAEIEKKFSLKVSKSSINAVFKSASLSLPVGRRSIKQKPQADKPPLLLEKLTETPQPVECRPDILPSLAKAPFAREIIASAQKEVDSSLLPGYASLQEEAAPEAAAQPEPVIEPSIQPVESPVQPPPETTAVTQPQAEAEKAEPEAAKEAIEETPENLKEATRSPEKTEPPVVKQTPEEQTAQEALKPAAEDQTAEKAKPAEQMPEALEPAKEATTPPAPQAQKPAAAQPVFEPEKEATEIQAAQEPAQHVKKPLPKEPVPTEEKQPAEVSLQKPAPLPEHPVAEPREIKIKEPLETPAAKTAGTTRTGAQKTRGLVILKAADNLLGGSRSLAELFRNRVDIQDKRLNAKIEALVYGSLFQELASDALPTDEIITADEAVEVLDKLRSSPNLIQESLRLLFNGIEDVRCIKFILSEGNQFFIDGQFRSVWSSQHTPHSFSNALANTKLTLNKYLYENNPLIIFCAPGRDVPAQELFDMIASLNYSAKPIKKIGLCGHRDNDLEVLAFDQSCRHYFIFGMFPWQYVKFRRVKKLGEFKTVTLGYPKGECLLAKAQVELIEPSLQQSVVLNGCAFKTDPSAKIKVVMLSNMPEEMFTLEEMADAYFNRWINTEEGFQDFSRKLELFTYTAGCEYHFSADNLNLNPGSPYTEFKSLFTNYARAADLYARWSFFPQGYEKLDFLEVKRRIYSLDVEVKREQRYAEYMFERPAEASYAKDLEYICRRLNEREIVSADGRRLWFSIK